MEINLNVRVRATLTDEGKKLWREDRQEVNRHYGKELYPISADPPTEWQLWELMHLIGPKTFIGNRPMIEGNTFELMEVPEHLQQLTSACKELLEATADCGYDCRQIDVMKAEDKVKAAIAKVEGK